MKLDSVPSASASAWHSALWCMRFRGPREESRWSDTQLSTHESFAEAIISQSNASP